MTPDRIRRKRDSVARFNAPPWRGRASADGPAVGSGSGRPDLTLLKEQWTNALASSAHWRACAWPPGLTAARAGARAQPRRR